MERSIAPRSGPKLFASVCSTTEVNFSAVALQFQELLLPILRNTCKCVSSRLALHNLRPIGGKITHLRSKTACKAVFATSRETFPANDAYEISLSIPDVIQKLPRIIVRDCPCSQSQAIKMSEIVGRSKSLQISSRSATARGRRSARNRTTTN